jgi:multiple antibiotic resistance protein
MLQDWITLIGATFAALFPIANPFSTAPVFVAITRNLNTTERLGQARMACVYMFAVLAVTLLAGALILAFFGISLAALRLAGGLIVARIGFGMLNPAPEEELPSDQRRVFVQRTDVAFTPLAMPLLSGPGSIAVTIGMATEVARPLENIAILVGIALVTLACWLVLRSSTRVVDKLGETGVSVLTRIMGLLLVCIGIQFVFRGLQEVVTDPSFMGAVVEAIRAAGGG